MSRTCVRPELANTVNNLSLTTQIGSRLVTRLTQVQVHVDCICLDEAILPVEKLNPLHVVFLVDTSDSFNSADTAESKAGEIMFRQFVAPIIENAKFSDRAAPTSVTVVNFSGIKSQSGNTYEPGTEGIVAGTGGLFRHYRVEIEPQNVAKLSGEEIAQLAAKLGKDNMLLEGNGQLYLALQDLSIKSFQDKIAQTTGGDAGDKILVIITDDEWDIDNLPLSDEISSAKDLSEDDKKQAIVKHARQKFKHILPIVVPKPVSRQAANTPRAEDAKDFVQELGTPVYIDQGELRNTDGSVGKRFPRAMREVTKLFADYQLHF